MARSYQMSSQRLKLNAVGHVLLAFLGVIGLLSLFSNHLLRNPILHGIWNKLAILQSVVLRELEKPADQRLQWLFWFDSDTVLMNPNMPLETFLPPPELPNVHLLTSRGWNGLHGGVFFLRVHPWSVELLSAAIAYPVSAINNVLAENEYFARSTVYCPLRWFNAYMRHPNGVDLDPKTPLHLQVSPGDLLVHFPGTPQSQFDAGRDAVS
ncbi:hypothetical protein KXX07_004958 [Aspergillus fumigatus]|nr:hypothetical protein KXX07_004958 [Aspergillus fumigatus]KAH2835267.1 hypothetical protein KXW76_002728 [Aspergillus fumigatus]